MPLDLLNAELSRLPVLEREGREVPSLFSEPIELDKDGTSSFCGRGISMAGTMVLSGCGGQHKVSRAHIRQLRFSNRLPSGIVLEHFEKTTCCQRCWMEESVTSIPVHIPNRLSTLRGSISCILPTSSFNTGA